jgi:ribonuclease HI
VTDLARDECDHCRAVSLHAAQTEPPAPRTKHQTRSRPRVAAMPAPPGAIEVYTDGACSGNPGPGGWAWVVDDGRHAAGSERVATNQRMEIRAALEAVQALPGPLIVVSDSTYVVNCFRDGWWRRWRNRGWTTAAKKPVANRDLWEPLVDLVEVRGDVAFRWVKGHSGNRLNDLADELAVAAGLNQTQTAGPHLLDMG